MSQSYSGANNLELLKIVESVSYEKNLDKEIVLSAMEDAVQKAAKTKYGAENDIKANIDHKTGQISISRLIHVVDEVENNATEIALADAKLDDPDIDVGGVITIPLPPVEFGRIAAQNSKQVIVQKVRDAEREYQYEEYKDKAGEIVNGISKRNEYGNIIVDLGRGEAVIRRDDLIPRENFRNGDRIRALISEVHKETKGPQIYLSRTKPEFVLQLFKQEVPEIYEGVVEIKSVARDPGSRAKIAVYTSDTSIDPIGACVGMRGSRVQAVVNELQGEKIDIIQWSDDVATLIVNALTPAEVAKVVIDEEADRIEVVVPDEHQSQAIGRRGQNVRLASQLTGWSIDILTEAEETERRNNEFTERSELFISALDVDEFLAQLLISESFGTIEEVAYVEVGELSDIEGIGPELAEEIQLRAREYLQARKEEMQAKLKEMKVSDELSEIEGITIEMMVVLGENDVKNIEDLAGCATDDLIGWRERNSEGVVEKHEGILSGHKVNKDIATDIIMSARVKAGWIDEGDLEVQQDESAGDKNALDAVGDEESSAASKQAVEAKTEQEIAEELFEEATSDKKENEANKE